MAMRRFVEAAGKKTLKQYRGLDIIPGTNKIRTTYPCQYHYSEESDLKRIINNRRSTVGKRTKL